MVPICDLTGQVIAFTGRKLDVTPENDPAFEAKYVNSPKTDLFNKGTLLFGIHIARKAVNADTPFIMVEGQLDAIRCWTEGFEQVVATQGTAITDIQLGKLKNYCPQLIMCLDGDSAGSKAAMRVLPMALSAGLELRFIRLPKGDDPDSFLKTYGKEAFRDKLEHSSPAVPFMIESFFDPDRRDGPSLSRSAEQCFEIIMKSDSQIVKSQMVEDLANGVGLDIRTLRSDFETFQRKKGGFSQRNNSVQAIGLNPGQHTKLRTVESDLLTLAIQNKGVREKLVEVDFTDLIDPANVEGRLLMRICAELREDPGWTPEQDSDLVCENDDERNLIYQLLTGETEEGNALDLFALCMKSMQLRSDKKRLRMIEHKLNKGVGISAEDMTAWLTEKLEIQRRIANQVGKH